MGTRIDGRRKRKEEEERRMKEDPDHEVMQFGRIGLSDDEDDDAEASKPVSGEERGKVSNGSNSIASLGPSTTTTSSSSSNLKIGKSTRPSHQSTA